MMTAETVRGAFLIRAGRITPARGFDTTLASHGVDLRPLQRWQYDELRTASLQAYPHVLTIPLSSLMDIILV